MSSGRSRRGGSSNVQILIRASKSSRNAPQATSADNWRFVPAISWKSLCDFSVGADGQETLVLQRPQQHRLLVLAQFADLVQKQQAAVGRAQQPRPVGKGAGKGAFDVTEQRRHGRVAAQRGAVHLDERRRRTAAVRVSARKSAAQAAICRRRSVRSIADGAFDWVATQLDLVDQPIEAFVARLDARLEKRGALCAAPARTATPADRTSRDRDR